MSAQRLLLVDDRQDNLLALEAVLEPLGLDLTTAASGEEALRRLLNEEFSLIVLDVQMPGLDGFETARLIKLREKTRHIPILFLTAISGAEEHHLEGYASGAIDYVYKPFEPAILRAKVAALLELMEVKERLEKEVADRTSSEQRLAERERQLAEAESLAHVGAWWWEPSSGLAGWSDELFRIFGVKPDSISLAYGTYLQFVHPDDQARVDEGLRRAHTTGVPYVMEHRAVRADGSPLWIRAQGQVVALENAPDRVFSAAQDVTQRKRAEEEFTQFFNLSLDLMAVVGFDGALQRANRSFTRLLGWSEEELMARPYLDLVHQDDLEEVLRGIAGFREGVEVLDRELRLLTARGDYRWFRVSGRPVPEDGVIYVVGIDITERKQAALLLAESEERYRVLVDHAPEAIVVLDLDGGHFVDGNPQAERLLGIGRAELCQMGPSDVTAPSWPYGKAPAAFSEDATEVWVRRARSGDTTPFEWVLQGAAAAPVLCEVRLLQLPATGRRLARGTLIDITERRRVQEAEAAVIERERALRQSQTIAQTLQRSLLPERLPEIPGIGLAARYLPGSAGLEVGGDWYDVIPAPSGAVCLAIGDVVGRGLRAAATMGQLRTALRAYALQGSSPSRVIEHLEGLAKGLPEAQMTTLVYAMYEPEAGALTYVCAGHPPPLVIHPDGSSAYLGEGRGLPLGVHAAVTSEAAVVLEPGSTLVFYTDGLIERPGSVLDDGMEALARTARSVAGADPNAVAEAITGAMIGDSSPHDDVALLVVACAPALSDQFHLTLATDPQRLRSLRKALNRWLVHVGASSDEARDIVLAASEAVTNSIVHAYGTEGGKVEVEGTVKDGAVTVTVSDAGDWRFLETPGGGRGLLLMGALVPECRVETGPEGTRVTLRRVLGQPLEPSESVAVEVSIGDRAAGLQDGESIAVVPLLEDVDVSNVRHVGNVLANSVRKEQWGLVVDASRMPYLDSSAVRLLVDLKRRLERHRQVLWAVLPPDSPVHRVLELTGVGNIIPVAASVEQALSAIRRERALAGRPQGAEAPARN